MAEGTDTERWITSTEAIPDNWRVITTQPGTGNRLIRLMTAANRDEGLVAASGTPPAKQWQILEEAMLKASKPGPGSRVVGGKQLPIFPIGNYMQDSAAKGLVPNWQETMPQGYPEGPPFAGAPTSPSSMLDAIRMKRDELRKRDLISSLQQADALERGLA